MNDNRMIYLFFDKSYYFHFCEEYTALDYKMATKDSGNMKILLDWYSSPSMLNEGSEWFLNELRETIKTIHNKVSFLLDLSKGKMPSDQFEALKDRIMCELTPENIKNDGCGNYLVGFLAPKQICGNIWYHLLNINDRNQKSIENYRKATNRKYALPPNSVFLDNEKQWKHDYELMNQYTK